MHGRAGVAPTDTNGSVAHDLTRRSPASAPSAEPVPSIPLTIREVVRRGRAQRDEVNRLRDEVQHLRLRAESAERLLRTAPEPAAPTEPDPNAQDGHVPADLHRRPDGSQQRSPSDATPRWATAAVFPRPQHT